MRHGSANRLSLLCAAIAGVSLIAVPSGLGAKPVRTVVTPSEPFLIPAGLGCSFDVSGVPVDASAVITEFGSGRTVTRGRGKPTLTNLETGTTYVQNSEYKMTESYDPEANAIRVVVNGRIFLQFWPGDQGPYGEVGENGALFAFDGHVYVTVEADTEVYTSFSYKGTVIDLCSLLAA